MGAEPDFLVVRGRLPEVVEDELPELLADLEILGSEVGFVDGDGRVSIAVYLAADDAPGARAAMELLDGSGAIDLVSERRATEDWMAAYRRAAQATPLGRTWWIDPRPDSPSPAPAGRVRLAVEPRMAFGTGSHETTRLVLEILEERLLEGLRVLDMGSGSGILSLACLARGAAWVVGVDVDPQSVWVARETLFVQDRPWRPHYVVGSVDCVHEGGFDLVVCNMLVERFTPLLDGLVANLAPDGRLLLSGLLNVQRQEVFDAVHRFGLRSRAEWSLEDWAAVELSR